MSVTALSKERTVDLKSNAVQCQQIKDNSGNAINTADLTNLAPGNRYVAAGSTKTLLSTDNGKTIKLDTAAGSTVTLPAASGTGNKWFFVVTVLATSNSHIIKVANSSDAMQGIIYTGDDTSANAQWFAAVAGTDDTITLNRTTTGSVTLGEWIEIEDIATNRFQVRGFVTNTGTAATQFSATV